MALSSTDLKARMDREFKILGLSSSKTSEKTDILTDALDEFVSLMDPFISANVSIVAGTTRYSIPATIEKVQDLHDTDYTSQVFSIDLNRSEIILQDSPTTTETWVMYGSPADIKTNVDTIVVGLKTDYESVLWAFIKYAAHEWANSDKADGLYQKARIKGLKKRASLQRQLGWDGVSVKTLDTTGANVADSSNREGFTADNSDYLKSDL